MSLAVDLWTPLISRTIERERTEFKRKEEV